MRAAFSLTPGLTNSRRILHVSGVISLHGERSRRLRDGALSADLASFSTAERFKAAHDLEHLGLAADGPFAGLAAGLRRPEPRPGNVGPRHGLVEPSVLPHRRRPPPGAAPRGRRPAPWSRRTQRRPAPAEAPPGSGQVRVRGPALRAPPLARPAEVPRWRPERHRIPLARTGPQGAGD